MAPSFKNLLDNPKELLELINECLKPKEIEKKKFGEVFTPMDFINNKQLKDIETYWLNKNNENIWSNDKLTWYDPATGMGNYPIAIYYKLMEGLKNKIPNDIERKKHIIEKQLYMGELNKIKRALMNASSTSMLHLTNKPDIDPTNGQADADFAGDLSSSRSTSGGFLKVGQL